MKLNPGLMIPEGFLLVSAIVMLLVDLAIPERQKNKLFAGISFIVLVVTLFLTASAISLEPRSAFNGFIKKVIMVVISQLLIHLFYE